MSNLSQFSVLSKTALEAVVNLFYYVFTRTLNRDFVEFALDTTTSELVITSKQESASGEVGIYRGSYRWPYGKASLQQVLPHPLAVEIAYPVSFRLLRQQLLTRYEFLVEEGELDVVQDGVGLQDDQTVSADLANSYGQLRLYATSKSGRFVANSYLTLMFIQPNTRIPLRALLDFKSGPTLGAMVGA
ncbi:hypothetical protein LUCX_294 [Xanthomonas phage vB_XciM_LucasX]|nr:hypothetical protein LUCX_294 [Xanthomonas phage vB_XciM_LucasX]